MTLAGLRPGEKLYEELLVKTEELDNHKKLYATFYSDLFKNIYYGRLAMTNKK